MLELPLAAVREAVYDALSEDVGSGDITSMSTVAAHTTATGAFVAKGQGVVCGLPVASEVFSQVDHDVMFRALASEGALCCPGDILAEVSGSARSILTAERVALNFLQRLSGVAGLTAAMVHAVRPLQVRIVDTRKTTPGLRALEKYAVRCAGGHNHRMGLYDAVMIKDNHIAAAGGITAAVSAARAAVPHTATITVECESLPQVEEALDAGANILLLDNMELGTLADAVRLVGGRAVTEASGGVTLKTIRSIAETGVNIISVGALTHSAPALDISLDLRV